MQGYPQSCYYHQVCQEVAETEVAAAVAGEMAH